MKRFLILATLGLFLATQGAAAVMAFAPSPAVADYSGSNC
jgi:hypothetical protein